MFTFCVSLLRTAENKPSTATYGIIFVQPWNQLRTVFFRLRCTTRIISVSTAVVGGVVLYLHVVRQYTGNVYAQLLFLVGAVGNKVSFESSMQEATTALDQSQAKHLSSVSYFGTGRRSARSQPKS